MGIDWATERVPASEDNVQLTVLEVAGEGERRRDGGVETIERVPASREDGAWDGMRTVCTNGRLFVIIDCVPGA